MPVLVVEVDGYAFYASNKLQLEREKIGILRKYSIPILRVSTNESGEGFRLYNKLCEVFKYFRSFFVAALHRLPPCQWHWTVQSYFPLIVIPRLT